MSQIQKLLLEKINSNKDLINDWFKEGFKNNPAIFYNSVDLRHSGFKIAPIDNNCYPAGFNNLSQISRDKAKKAILEFLKNNYPDVKKILLIPENHTRNFKYLENILVLKSVLENDSKIEVEIGSLIDDLDDNLEINLPNDDKIILNKLIQTKGRIVTKLGFDADLVIINNDFTNFPPAIIKNIEQDIIPSINLGWNQRTKSKHFNIYENLALELAKLIDIDVWLIDAIHKNCQNIDFKNKQNIDELAKKTDEILTNIKNKYKEYDVKEEAYCYVKADSGTYGMAMMTIKDTSEILDINKKQRNKMNMIKGNIVNDRVIIQEGIPTIDRINNIIAEPMIYLINGKVVGNLSRLNEQRDQNISLNSAGMEFKDMLNISDENLNIGGKKEDIFTIYEVIAKLSALAAAKELN